MPEGIEISLPPPPVEKVSSSEEPSLISPKIDIDEASSPLPIDQTPEGEGIAENILGESFKHGVEKEKDDPHLHSEETGNKAATLARDIINVVQLVAAELINVTKGGHVKTFEPSTPTPKKEEGLSSVSSQTELTDQPKPDISQMELKEQDQKEETPVTLNEPVTAH